MAPTTLMSRPGPCVILNRPSPKMYENTGPFILPFEDSTGITTTQTLVPVLEKLYSYVQESIIGVAGDLGSGTGAAVARALLEVSNLTGIQIGSKGFHAQAWGGAVPSNFNIVVKFNRGMAGKWDSAYEVYNPARQLYALTLPFEAPSYTGVVSSPVPSPLDVFEAFGAEVVNSAISALGSTANTVTLGNFQTQIGNTTNNVNTSVIDLFKTAGANLGQDPSVWEVDFGYYPGYGNTAYTFLNLSNLIVQTSSIKFGTGRELNGTNLFYPTSAEVSLSFVSQSFFTSADFGAK